MRGVNETRFLVQHKSYECKCGLTESIGNSKQKWSHDECLFGCKELDDWSYCKDDYMYHSSECDWERNKACKATNVWTLKIVHGKNVCSVH